MLEEFIVLMTNVMAQPTKQKRRRSYSQIFIFICIHMCPPTPLTPPQHKYHLTLSLSWLVNKGPLRWFSFSFSHKIQTLISHSLILSHQCTSFPTISTIVFLARPPENSLGTSKSPLSLLI